MAGIIGQTIANNQPVYGAETDDYNETTRTVDSGTETVAGQLSSLLASGNPYLERAKSGAAQTANSRGLLNTSMAAGAGEAAAIDAALPIASADANTYTTASRENQGFKNTADQFNAGAKNASNAATAGAANTSLLSGQQAEQQRVLAAQSGQIQSTLQGEAAQQKIAQLIQSGQLDQALQTLKGTQATTLANIEAGYKDLMQTSASASTFFTQSSKNINDILADPNTSVEQKQSAVNTQTNLLQSAMTVIGAIANVDLAGLLDFSGAAA